MTPDEPAELSQSPWHPPHSDGYDLLPNPGDPEIVRNGAVGPTTPGVSRPTSFTLDRPYLLTQFITYHYGAEKSPGRIGLTHADGTVYGPWQAAGAVGQGNVRNAYWYVQPYVMLKPGHYTVSDSDPDTWCMEDCTAGAGIILLWGREHHSHHHQLNPG